MTQADGKLPTAAEIRLQLRELKPVLLRVESALVRTAAVPEGASIKQRFAALAELSAAYEGMREALVDSRVALGLPYDAVIENVSYTAVFGPDD